MPKRSLMMAEQILLHNAQVYRRGHFRKEAVVLTKGKIEAVGHAAHWKGVERKIDLAGQRLVPGFIDVHTHGGAGVDVNAASAGDLRRLAAFFASHGTTGWLASILTDTRQQTLRCIREVRRVCEKPTAGAQLLGIHLEGPFLAKEYKGAMPEGLLRTADIALFQEYRREAGAYLRYITVSPEVEGVPELIAQIAEEITVAIGHSGADYETALACIKNGATAATHTFNAMRLFHQHRPAIMGAVLESDVYCEAICDGRHLHPGAVRLLLKCKGWDKVVAITDSIQAAGLPDGRYKLGVNDVVVRDGDAMLADGTSRAGSTLTQDAALRNIMRFTGQPMEKVLPLFTENPARLLHLETEKGAIEPGMDADLTVLDQEGRVQLTLTAGKIVYSRAQAGHEGGGKFEEA